MRSISDKDLEVQLSIISAYQDRQFAHQHKELYAFITSKPFDLKDPAFHAIYQDIAAFYERALAPFCSSKEAIIDASRFFHAAIHGFVSAEHAKLFTFPRSCEEQMMLDTFGKQYQQYITRTGRVLPKFSPQSD